MENLLPTAIPKVTIVKHARYLPEDTSGDASSEVDILARIEKNLRDAPLAGFVAEGSAPFGAMSNSVDAALKRATFSGMPVVKVGRGNAGGFVDPTRDPLAIAGSNLTATKARLLLMACLMKFGCLPPAADPAKPTAAETEATKAKLKAVSRSVRYSLIRAVGRTFRRDLMSGKHGHRTSLSKGTCMISKRILRPSKKIWSITGPNGLSRAFFIYCGAMS